MSSSTPSVSLLSLCLLVLAAPLFPASTASAAESPMHDVSVSLKYGNPVANSLKVRGAWLGDLPSAPVLLDGVALRFSGAYGEGGTGTITLAATGWKVLPDGKGLKYTDRSGAGGGIRSLLLRPGRNGGPGALRIVGKGIDYDHRAAHTTVRVAMEIGLDRWCAEVPVEIDDGSKLQASGVDAPASCPPDLVVGAGWLEGRLAHPDVQVIDTRASFSGGHIPGAIPLRPDQLVTTVEGVAWQMMAPEDADDVLSAIGLRRDATVVVYGVPPEYDPARVTWSLHYLGHPDVRYLDGGWNAWMASGGPVDPGAAVAGAPTTYVADPIRSGARTTGSAVLAALGDPPYDAPQVQLVDARSSGEYAAGRIPTASLQPWTANLAGGFLLERGELEDLYPGFDHTLPASTYCLVGWRASVSWLAMAWIGFEDLSVYDGSWTEWGAGGFPIESGS